MGCMNSKDGALSHVDDSVHVMLKQDKKNAKKHGKPNTTGYVPRAEHPLLQHPTPATAAVETTTEASQVAVTTTDP